MYLCNVMVHILFTDNTDENYLKLKINMTMSTFRSVSDQEIAY